MSALARMAPQVNVSRFQPGAERRFLDASQVSANRPPLPPGVGGIDLMDKLCEVYNYKASGFSVDKELFELGRLTEALETGVKVTMPDDDRTSYRTRRRTSTDNVDFSALTGEIKVSQRSCG